MVIGIILTRPFDREEEIKVFNYNNYGILFLEIMESTYMP